MYLMYADEADREQNRGQRFFIYGAVFVDCARVSSLHDAVERIRNDNGFAPTDSLKFATNTKPAQVSREAHTAAKAAVIEAAAEHGVTFCAYVMLHDVAAGREHEELVQWGANTLLGKFNEYLADKEDGFGLVMFDRMPIAHEHRYFREKFTIGLTFRRREPRRLERILGLASTCDGASHLSSVTDIVLGSFRYCVNEPEGDIAGRAMMPGLVRLMWKREDRRGVTVREYGFVARPLTVRGEQHSAEYAALRERLAGYASAGPP